MIGNAELALAGLVACGLAAAAGAGAGYSYRGTLCDKAALEHANADLKEEKGWQRERDEASTRAAEAAALTAGQQAALKARATQLEQEVAAYATDQTREHRQCFDARGSSLWNAIAKAPAADATGVRRQPDAEGGAGSPDASAGRGE